MHDKTLKQLSIYQKVCSFKVFPACLHKNLHQFPLNFDEKVMLQISSMHISRINAMVGGVQQLPNN